jgi:ATP adenylyltransferase
MDQVFAPWRIDWVEREHDDGDGCVFCRLPDGVDEHSDDRERYLLARGEHAYVLLNNYPYNPGHAMVIPYEHTGDYGALDGETLLGKERLLQRTVAAAETALDADGFNVGYNLGHGAGGSIDDHIHAHVVPRWAGDTNFMPVLADTKVIVEAVTDTYDRLHEAFAGQDGVTDQGPDRAVRVAGEAT